MAEREQTYKSHARFFPLFHFFVVPILLINFLNRVRYLILFPERPQLWAAIVAAALVGLALAARLMALAVQNRIIRLEMRLRLHEVLPADLHARIRELTWQQLVALRFASDEELPGLVREVLDGKLATAKEIKLRVKSWQADWLRA